MTLVTGGAGYVGSVLARELLQTGRHVRVLDSLLHGSTSALPHGDVELIVGDVRDAEARRTALAGVDEVVHLAAIVGDPACARQPEAARSVNVDATAALVREAGAAGVSRFLLASTCSNYGKSDTTGLATEGWELSPVSLYAETKVAAELDVLDQSANGLGTTCLRFATVYGVSPQMRFDLTVNQFTRDLVLGRELVVYGEQFWRPYVHVRDAARGVVAVLRAPADRVRAQVFNVGDSAENYRKLDLIELMRHRIPSARVSFVSLDEDPRDYRVSFQKIQETLGYEVCMAVPGGIDEIAELVASGRIADPDAGEYGR